MALILARRVLRGWRLWTVREQLLAPTWQQIRLNARLLPPLPTPPTPTRPRTSPTASESHADYYYGRSPWRSHLSGHWGNAESVELTSNYDQWRSAQDSLLQDFDRLHPGRVWLRSWHTVDFPISRSHCPTVLWYDFLPSRFTTPPFGQMLKRDRYSRPPIKFRYVICHYGQPFSWHWIEAAPTSGPTHYFQPHGPATEWQETVLFTIVGSSPGSSTTAVHSFNASPTHPKPFTTMVSVTPAAGESAEYYSSKEVEVADFPGELTYCTQSSVESALEASSLPSLPPQSEEERSETSSSENDEAWTIPVSRLWQLCNPECIPRRLSSWEWRMVESAWYSWLHFHQDLRQWHSTGTVIEGTSEPDCDLPRASTQDFQYESTSCSEDSFSEGEYEPYDVSEMHSSEDDETEDSSADSEFNALDSEGDLFRLSTQDLRSTRELRVLAQAWVHWLQFVEKRRCYSDSFSDDSFDSEYEDFIEWPCLLARVPASDPLPTRGAQKPWRSGCVITLDEADTDGTWELPSLTAADCDGELELIRYTTCSSAIAFEDNAAAAISWERSASLGGRLDRALFASQLASVKDYWEIRQGLLQRRHTMRAPPAKFSTKRGRRLHRQELRRARAHRKSHRTDIPRPAQPAAQLRSPFPFAPPTAPTIPLTASRGVFMFGATVMSSGIDSSPTLSSATLSPSPLSSATSSESSFSSSLLLNSPRSMARQTQRMRALQESANLSTDPRSHGCATCDRPQVTTQSDQSKHYVARCKLDGCGASLGLLQPGILLCPMDDSSVEDSEQASAASTVPLLITILSLLHGFRPALPRYRRRKARDGKGNWQLSQPSTADTDFGKRLWQPRAHFSRCTRAHLKALGRSRWLNGLCRCLHSGCTNGTGPRPSIEP